MRWETREERVSRRKWDFVLLPFTVFVKNNSMGKIIAIANQKESRKDNDFYKLATSLAVLDKKVFLLVMPIPKQMLPSGLGVDPQQVKSSIYECLVGQSSIKESVVRNLCGGLGLVASHIDLVGAELELI